jgi:hypothetical protein
MSYQDSEDTDVVVESEEHDVYGLQCTACEGSYRVRISELNRSAPWHSGQRHLPLPTGWDRCVPSRLIERLLPKGLSTPGAKLSLHLTPISRSARQSFSFTRYTTSALVPIAGLYVRGTMRHDMGLNVRKGRPSGYLPSLP